MLGKIELENFAGLNTMPQRAASAWDAVMTGLTGIDYKPLIYCGSQIVKGTNYYFVAEMSIPYARPARHIVLLAINEFQEKYEIVKGSVEVIL